MSGLSGEDRARLEGLLDYLQRTEDHPQAKADVDVFARALALIDQQEKALEAADGLSEAVSKFSILSGMFDPEKSRAAYANDFYRSARATSTKEDG